MPIDKDIYSIHAVRLVNFHNINHVTIPVTDGGHLFLLGDNGSGKTTVLDAIHYVLSAGELELNSAARMGGNKNYGRRINGVITAYNMELGADRFSDGRVTYAAIELRNGAGIVTSLGVGLSIANAGAPLQQWGFRINVPVAELPLLLADNNGNEYPPDREEFKKTLQQRDGHYYTSMTTYAQAVARDFFPTKSQYDEYRKFLNMCKAYREISSKAGNYHELFKSLLPEPDTETLRDLRNSLRNLRESHSALFALEKKCLYLTGLHDKQKAIDKARETIGILESGIYHFDLRKQQQLLMESAETDKVMTEEAERLKQAKEHGEEKVQALARSIADLNGRDASNLIETEKSRSKEWEIQKHKSEKSVKMLDELANRKISLTAKHAGSLKDFRDGIALLAGKLAENLAAWPNLPLKDTLNALQAALSIEMPYIEFESKELRSLYYSFGGQEERLKAGLELAKQSFETVKKEKESAEQEILTLQKEPEACPENLPEYRDLLDDLERDMLDGTPLYLKLHWKKDVADGLRGAVEELIGEDTLATIVGDSECSEKIKELLLSGYSGFRFAERHPEGLRAASQEIHEFLNDFFDSNKDSVFLEVLARELDGIDVPKFDIANPPQFVNWRGTFRTLDKRCARLIGEEERRAEQKRRIVDAKELLQSRIERFKAAEMNVAELDKKIKALQRFSERFNVLYSALQNDAAELKKLDKQRTETDADLLKEEEENAVTVSALNNLTLILAQLRKQIKERNLQALEEEIARLHELLKAEQDILRRANDSYVGQSVLLKAHLDERNKIQEKVTVLQRQLDEMLANGKICKTQDSLIKYLSEERLASARECSERIAECKSSIDVSIGFINAQANVPDWVDYGFNYDAPTNEFYSREHSKLSVILDKMQSDLAQQREILNEETRRNFEHILLEQFRNSLRNRIYSLEHMCTKINHRLKGHLFGRNSYSLKIEPLSDYAPLVNVLRSFSDQTPESAEELKEIFARHTNEILETPATQIPPVLDYRNYFNYKMLLYSGTQDGMIIDSRAKSIGSGGEQAVPNYLLVMMIAHLLFDKTEGTNSRIKINSILFDEAFYGIDSARKDQLLAFAEELGLQLAIASPDQDGIKSELSNSTNVFVRKDKEFQVHFFRYNWKRNRDLYDDGSDKDLGMELM